MITLSTPWDYVLMLLVAAIAGAIGGFGFEVLSREGAKQGSIERLHRAGDNLIDLGVLAWIFVGAIAAVAVLWIYPPAMTITVNAADNSTTSVPQYDLVKLVALALVAGASGPTVINAARQRLAAALAEQKTKTVTEVAKSELSAVNQDIQAVVDKSVQAAVDKHQPQAQDIIASAVSEVPPDLAKVLYKTTDKELKDLVDQNTSRTRVDRSDDQHVQELGRLLEDIKADASANVRGLLDQRLKRAELVIEAAAR